MGESLIKNILDEILDTIEDVATAVFGFVLLVFAAGALYGAKFANTPQLWYPLYIFLALLALKLVKDLFKKGGKHSEKKK